LLRPEDYAALVQHCQTWQTYIPGAGLLDELPTGVRLGATRVGGVDLNKPRMHDALCAALALAPAPNGFTVAEFTAKMRYHVPPLAARTIAALLTLRDQVIAPILAAVRSPRMGANRALDTRRP
jgi:hypothetical protein